MDAEHVIVDPAVFLLHDLAEVLITITIFILKVFLSQFQVLVVLLFDFGKSDPLAVFRDQRMGAAQR